MSEISSNAQEMTRILERAIRRNRDDMNEALERALLHEREMERYKERLRMMRKLGLAE